MKSLGAYCSYCGGFRFRSLNDVVLLTRLLLIDLFHFSIYLPYGSRRHAFANLLKPCGPILLDSLFQKVHLILAPLALLRHSLSGGLI